VSRPRDTEPPAVEWDRDYGENGLALREEARRLLAEGMGPGEVARELVARYGRQCESTGRELMAAVRGAEGRDED